MNRTQFKRRQAMGFAPPQLTETSNSMTILAKATETPNFTPASNDVHAAVCCDVVDMGNVKTEWQGKTRQVHKVRIVFQVDEVDDQNGKPIVVGQMFTLSLSEKANLRKFLESWRGKAFTGDELKDGFDVEKLIGAPATIQTLQVTRGDRVYANIQTIMRLVPGQPRLEVRDYIRMKDRTEGQQTGDSQREEEDDDLPF